MKDRIKEQIVSKGTRKLQDRTEKARPRADAPLGLPVWGAETWTPPVSDPFAPGYAPSPAPDPDVVQSRAADEREGGCLQMTRFVRFATALSALAAIFLVAGAGSKA